MPLHFCLPHAGRGKKCENLKGCVAVAAGPLHAWRCAAGAGVVWRELCRAPAPFVVVLAPPVSSSTAGRDLGTPVVDTARIGAHPHLP